MTDRRSFFARILGGAAVVPAIAASNEPLIVMPQSEPVQLYSRIPEVGMLNTPTDFRGGSMLTAATMNGIGCDLRVLAEHVDRLNAAVFGNAESAS